MTSSRPVILVLSHDASLAATKTSRHLLLALEKLGAQVIGRDTRTVRWTIHFLEEREELPRLDAFELAIETKWEKLVADYNVQAVVSLDLNWLLSPRIFLESDTVRKIHSFWFDDLRSHLVAAPLFPLRGQSLLSVINHKKVSHYCYGLSQQRELEELGVQQSFASRLAAPAEYLEMDSPCLITNKIGFVGNPGLPMPPSDPARQLMQKGASMTLLRELARDEILDEIKNAAVPAWLQISGLRDLLAAALEARLAEPHTSALSHLKRAGESFPNAFLDLNRSGHSLDAAFLIKLVNRYDRPGLVSRLWRRGWMTVYGTPEQWLPYGIKAQPTVAFPHLPQTYQNHAVHLNAANCSREASANEKLFEIAALGRLSLNIDSPDVRACYGADEVTLLECDDALETSAEYFLAHPEEALACGRRARERTAREHLWEHRLAGVLK